VGTFVAWVFSLVVLLMLFVFTIVYVRFWVHVVCVWADYYEKKRALIHQKQKERRGRHEARPAFAYSLTVSSGAAVCRWGSDRRA
jgi:ABC-type Fe3+ transport system permease subunit